MNAETTADEKEPVENVSTNLSDPHVVRGLFELAAQEVLFRLIAVSGGRMKADQARDMDEALAKHLARALMGENPQFRAVPGWSGIACARSLAAADRAFYETYFPAGTPEPDNPRALMVQATTVVLSRGVRRHPHRNRQGWRHAGERARGHGASGRALCAGGDAVSCCVRVNDDEKGVEERLIEPSFKTRRVFP